MTRFGVAMALVCSFAYSESYAGSETFFAPGNTCKITGLFSEDTNGFPLHYHSDGVTNFSGGAWTVVCPVHWSGTSADISNPNTAVSVYYRDQSTTTSIHCAVHITNLKGAVTVGASRFSCSTNQLLGCTSDTNP